MAKKYDSELVWNEIDPSTLEGVVKIAYEDYVDMRRKAAHCKQVFEDHMNTNAPEGKRFVFGYNFGKLSIAVTEAKDAPKVKPAKLSLMEYLAQQQASGKRA